MDAELFVVVLSSEYVFIMKLIWYIECVCVWQRLVVSGGMFYLAVVLRARILGWNR